MYEMARQAVESLYDGVCTITGTKEVFNFVTKATSYEEVVICENEPCRLSYSSINPTNQTDTVNVVSQTTKLFIRPELEILNGSKIEVTQHGRTRVFIASGEPALYRSHQEVPLTLEDRRA